MRVRNSRKPRLRKPGQPITHKAPGGLALTAVIFIIAVVAMAVVF